MLVRTKFALKTFPGVKRPRRGVDHQLPSRGEVKERVAIYTSTPPLGLRGLFWGELYFYLYLYLVQG